MKLVASLMVGPNELDRYLYPCVAHLAEFCDEIRIRWEGLGDLEGIFPGGDLASVAIKSVREPTFFQHEGKARQELLDWTLEAQPTHVLAIDADELVSDGLALRAACEADEGPGAWTLGMEEIWKADTGNLWARADGGWRPHEVPILWRVPKRVTGDYGIQQTKLACGREPMAVRKLYGRAVRTGVQVLHFGWTNQAARAARYQRYVEHDGGRHHASAHLKSIMFPDRRVRLQRRPWPVALAPWKDTLLERVHVEAVA